MKYGYFDDPAREYVITRPDTPKPWSNYIGSAEFGGVVTNNAAGYTFYLGPLIRTVSQWCRRRSRTAEVSPLSPAKMAGQSL